MTEQILIFFQVWEIFPSRKIGVKNNQKLFEVNTKVNIQGMT